MSKFNFKSSVCTNKIQSERLLALGLKKETADCFLMLVGDLGGLDLYTIRFGAPYDGWTEGVIPAWSLGRLLEICGEDRLPISFHKKGKVKIRVNHIHPTHDGRSDYNYYDSIIDCIEWLIKEGYFNNDYLI